MLSARSLGLVMVLLSLASFLVAAPPPSPLIIVDESHSPKIQRKSSGFGRSATSESQSSEGVRGLSFGHRVFKSATVLAIKDMMKQILVIEQKVLRLTTILPPPRRRVSSNSLLVEEHNVPLSPRDQAIADIVQSFKALERLHAQVTEENKKDQDMGRRLFVEGGLETVYGLKLAVSANFYFVRKLGFLGTTYRVVETKTHDIVIQPLVSRVNSVQGKLNEGVHSVQGSFHKTKESVVGGVVGIGQMFGEVDYKQGVVRVVEGTRGLIQATPQHLQHAGEAVEGWIGGVMTSIAKSNTVKTVQNGIGQLSSYLGRVFTSDEEQAGIFAVFRRGGRVRQQVHEYEEIHHL